MMLYQVIVLVWISIVGCRAQDPPPVIDLPPPPPLDGPPGDTAAADITNATVTDIEAPGGAIAANESSANASFPDILVNDTADAFAPVTGASNDTSLAANGTSVIDPTIITDTVVGNETVPERNVSDVTVVGEQLLNDTAQNQTAVEPVDVPSLPDVPPPVQTPVDLGLPPPLDTNVDPNLPSILPGSKSPSPDMLLGGGESATSSDKGLASEGVDVPPPPLLPPMPPSVLFSEDVGSTTVEISDNMADMLSKLTNMGGNGTAGDTAPLSYVPDTTTPMSVDLYTGDPAPPTTAPPLGKTTVPYLPPSVIADIPTIDHPPPIFSGNRRPPMFDLTSEPPTVKYVPATLPPDAPPPPIVVPSQSDPLPTEPQPVPRIEPVISPIEQLRRLRTDAPPPRFMSVSELTELALRNIDTANNRYPPAGLQVFFNARLEPTTTPLPPLSMIGSTNLVAKQAIPIASSQSVAVNPGLSQTPIEHKPFYDANYLLSHLDDIARQSIASKQMVEPLPPTPRPPTRPPPPSTTTEKPFYNANFLLSHLSELRGQPIQQTTTKPATATPRTQTSNNLPQFFPHEIQRIQREQQMQLLQQQEQLKKQQEIETRQLQLQMQQQVMQQNQLEEQRQRQQLIEQQQRLLADQKMQEYIRLQEFQRQQLKQKQQDAVNAQSTGIAPSVDAWSLFSVSSKVKPGVIESVSSERSNNNIMKDQRQTLTDTRPMNFKSTPDTQTFIDYNMNNMQTHTAGKTPVDQTGLQDNVFEDIFTNIRGDISKLLPRSYVYGESSAISPANTQRASNRLSAFREKLNRQKQSVPTNVPINQQIQTSELRSLLGVRDNIHMNREFMTGGMQYTVKLPTQSQPTQEVPRTGSEVRRLFNQHMRTDTFDNTVSVKPLQHNILPEQSLVQQTQPQREFPLASKRAIDTSLFSQQLPTGPRTHEFGDTNSRGTVSSVSIFKAPALTSFSRRTVQNVQSPKLQTHWSVPSEQQVHSDHVILPYVLAPTGKVRLSGFPQPATPDSDLSVLQLQVKNTIQQKIDNINHIVTSAAEIPAESHHLLPVVTTAASTARPWVLTTMSPTLPPTADPNPPAIFSKNLQVTFMPMPKIERPASTPAPTGNIGAAGWESGPNYDERCRGCVFVNDRCLMPDSQHCNMYIECVRQGSMIRAFNRECAIGLFFDRNSFLCVDPSVADCPTDRCREGIKSYAIHGHCKNYWQCDIREGGRYFAVRACCPGPAGYVEGRGCGEDASCTENCNLTASINTEPTGCQLKKTSSPTRYFDADAREERPCAPGTLFDQPKCTCVQDISIERSESRNGGVSCSPKLKLTFDTGKVEDVSTTKQHVGVEGVAVSQSGEAIMTGASKLTLWRYANLMFPVVFAVRLRFRTTGAGVRYQTLITNCSPEGVVPTFEIFLDTLYHEVVITVDTYEGSKRQFKLSYQDGQWTTVDLIYDGERVVGSVDNRSRNIIAGGLIETRPSPLLVGSCDGKSGFKGLLDDVYFYEDCIPDDMYAIFMSVLQ